MNMQNLSLKKIWTVAMGGALLSLPAALAAKPAAAQVNPCPSIYMEYGIMREGCSVYGATPMAQPTVGSPAGNAIASVGLAEGTFDVRIINETNSQVNYEAVVATGDRLLPQGAEAVLRGLEPPTSLMFFQEDSGLVSVEVETMDDMLQITLTPAGRIGEDESVVRVQEDGQVYVL